MEGKEKNVDLSTQKNKNNSLHVPGLGYMEESSSNALIGCQISAAVYRGHALKLLYHKSVKL